MLSIPDLLVVSTHRNWIAAEFEAAGICPVRQDFGLWAPKFSPTKHIAWWAPMEHAAQLLHAGIDMNLSAPGPRWLSDVPTEFTRRRVWSGTIREARRRSPLSSGWVKPSECKIEELPNKYWGSTSDFIDHCTHLGITHDMEIQISPTTLNILHEYRVFIRGRMPATSTCYIEYKNIKSLDEPDSKIGVIAQSLRFAQEVVDAMGDNQPYAYTLDIALLTDNSWAVIEANPAWCSSPYRGITLEVVRTVIASSLSHNDEKTHEKFQWVPDPQLWVKISPKRKLYIQSY